MFEGNLSKSIGKLKTANLGFPRMGRQRELKFALEAYWSGKRVEQELMSTAAQLRREHWKLQQVAGLNSIPSNDFSLYDQVLDALVLVGAIPERFGSGPVTLEQYFQMARNSPEQSAMEMTKWFDTNYHYLVPEWSEGISFNIDTRKLLNEVHEARDLGIETRPVLIGPLTLLLLGKGVNGFDPMALLPKLTTAYVQILQVLEAENIEWVQVDEPMLVTDLDANVQSAYRQVYSELKRVPVKLMLTTYFDTIGDNLRTAIELDTAGLHIDVVRAPEQLEETLQALQPEQVLSVGCVEGRNIWLTDFFLATPLLRKAVRQLGADRVIVAPSCSLLHVPHDLRSEAELSPRIKSWLRFAEEKLAEISALASRDEVAYQANAAALADRASAETTTNPNVREALTALRPQDFLRRSPYPQRAIVQRNELQLPLLPTTTIGSFPQTAEVRKHRAAHKHGHETSEQYEAFLKDAIAQCIREQERIGLDVLVHGEFERNDMVEYFAEFLDGFAFTESGWVQSYGSRCVKPPIIYGDVSRPAPMTLKWTSYARSLTSRPLKGMLTGPITVLQWSFVRNDISRQLTAWQIALALRDEVQDLEVAGIRIIQVDEPALREGLPLRCADWPHYLDWAVKAFKLTTSSVEDETQIHTHMCYCEFEDILPSIAALDADVISMESARSRMELLEAFQSHQYPNEIGPGVYDIHSPRVPSAEEMQELLSLALDVLKPAQVWVNPDCGLKTRGWPETVSALENMCKAADRLRNQIGA
ncbi:5-methyltetrahydropteroyltriglutamate--homocysteine methyltransferase [Edaphobacter acidisoli]|uniref:5-methyltetrahydropteroyltriglutamate--homocysteine methyltransferase n=1 Tax=Edaphobacter acidisoli TaxID=2040573 RepID=A0A916RXU9_9BACT|nr:5-methyltetrahydropteroyltriglutamate--homocysteine S-methyltransferase [Edaphobacter acidisoli]GGA74526.1 5-methyltetrahydropteroyltriglutamate--homocysteine methyltransferase [Edaphobacter acidisoli]